MSESIVQTSDGPVRGKLTKNDVGKDYYSFQHIPYVKKLEGEWRFKDPRPVNKWTEVLDCTEEGPAAYQLDIAALGGPKYVAEDNCLGINVYTPQLKPSKLLPVFAYIHGGGFVSGSSSTLFYGPDYIIDHNVIMVSFNYRLNIFGFLSFKDPKVGVPGNAGLKDQSMALRWIKENISNFGGDPNNITLVGESAGSASVHYHTLSEMSKNLFNRAILMSGSAEKLGLSENASDDAIFKEIIECDAVKLLQINDDIAVFDEKYFDTVIWSPVLPQVEPYESEMCFLPKSCEELSKNPWSKDIDIIIGGVADEGLFLYFEPVQEEHMLKLNENHDLFLLPTVRSSLPIEEAKKAGTVLKELYYGMNAVSMFNRDKHIDYLGEKHFWYGICKHLKCRQTSDGQGKTYFYHLDAPPSKNIPQFYDMFRELCKIPHTNGTSHIEDLVLILKYRFADRFLKGHDNFDVGQRFLNTFLEFAKTGNPNSQVIKPVDWEPVSKEDDAARKCLVLTRNKCQLEALPNLDKIKIWESIHDQT